MVYDIEGFLEKNNDSLHDNLLELLDATVDPFLRCVVEYVDPEAGSECLLLCEGHDECNPFPPSLSIQASRHASPSANAP